MPSFVLESWKVHIWSPCGFIYELQLATDAGWDRGGTSPSQNSPFHFNVVHNKNPIWATNIHEWIFLDALVHSDSLVLVRVSFFFSTHSLGLVSTGGGSLLTDAWAMSSSDGLDTSLCSFSSSSGSLKCTRRPTLDLDRESLWFVWVPVLRQELGGGSGRGTTMGLPFWWFVVPLTLGLVSGDVTEGLDTCWSVSTADGTVKSFGYEKNCCVCLLVCGSWHVPLDPGGFWRRYGGSKFGVLVVQEFRHKLLLLRLVGSRLGRLERRGSGRSMLELLGSKRRVLVFKGSRRKVLERSGSSRMVLEWGLLLLITVTSGWRFTVGTDGEGSWTWLDSTVKLLKGLTWLLYLPLPEGNQSRCTEMSKHFYENVWQPL